MEETIRKDLYDISWKVDEPTYRADPALSQSTLGRFEREGFNGLDKLFEPFSSPSLTFGSAVDTYMTDGEDAFRKKFFVADFPSVGEKELKVANYLVEQQKDVCTRMDSIQDSIILDAANVFEFQKNWKNETRVKVLLERCSGYYKMCVAAGDKTVLNTETYTDVLNCVDALKSSPATMQFFAPDDPFSDIKRYYQLKFKARHNNVTYRGMLDLVMVDYANKIVYPCDLKTTGKKEWDFEKSVLEFGYEKQARLYWRLLRANMNADPYFKEFSLEPFRFIVINRKSLTPLVWEFPFSTFRGTLIDSKGNEYRDPFDVGDELKGYLDNRPAVPNGISTTKPNVINCLKQIEI